MSSYLPLGRKIMPTKEQVKTQQVNFDRYDYYGIPYGIIDGTDEGKLTPKDIDREQAKLFISQGKQLPKDLERRLLNYKQSELREKTIK